MHVNETSRSINTQTWKINIPPVYTFNTELPIVSIYTKKIIFPPWFMIGLDFKN